MFSKLNSSLLLTGLALFIASSTAFGQEVKWLKDLDLAKQQASKDGKLVLIHFYADWCSPCKQLDTFVFNREIVARKIAENMVPVKVHTDAHPDLLAEYNVPSIPFDVAITPNGNVVHRQKSPASSDNYIAMVERIGQMNGRVKDAGSKVANDATQFQNRFAKKGEQIQSETDSMEFGASNLNFQPNRFAQNDKSSNQFQPKTANAGSSDANAFRQRPETIDFVRNQHVDNTPERSSGDFQPANRGQFQASNSSNNFQPAMPSQDFQPKQTQPQPPKFVRNQFAMEPDDSQLAPKPQRIVNQTVAPQAEGVLEPVRNRPPAEINAQPLRQAIASNSQMRTQPDPAVASSHPVQPKSAFGNPIREHAASERVSTHQHKPAAQPKTNETKTTFALNGNCPVSLLTISKWVPGNRKHGCVHRGRTYLFASQEHMETFLSDPDRYSPVLAGFDPVAFANRGELIDGKESLGVFMSKGGQQKIVLFDSAANRDKFQKDPKKYLEAVRVATERVDSDTIRR